MFKIIASASIWFLLLSMVSLQAKEYQVLLLGVTSIHGPEIRRSERSHFIDGLEHELARKGHIKLAFHAPFLMKVHIGWYSKNFSRTQGKFLGSKQYHFKQKIHLEVQYAVLDRGGYELYHGTLTYNVSMDTGSSISYADAMRRAKKNMLKGIGERVGSRINDHFHFMMDFERQLDVQYGTQKAKKNSLGIYKKLASNSIGSNVTLDLERNILGSKNSKSDFKWEGVLGKNDMHFFRPQNQAKFAVIQGKSYKSIDKHYVKSKKLSASSFVVMDHDKSFKKGAVLVFKTTEGHYGKMQILGFLRKRGVLHYNIHIKWILF